MEFDLSNKDDVERIQKRAKSVAIRKGHPELADDFAQEIIVAFLKGWRQTFDQAFTDYLRSIYGNTRTACGAKRVKAELTMGEIDEERDIVDVTESQYLSGQFDFLFRGRQLDLYQLYFIEELSELQIAEMYGVSKSRICQMLKPVKEAISKYALMEELRTRIESGEQVGVFEVEWIRL